MTGSWDSVASASIRNVFSPVEKRSLAPVCVFLISSGGRQKRRRERETGTAVCWSVWASSPSPLFTPPPLKYPAALGVFFHYGLSVSRLRALCKTERTQWSQIQPTEIIKGLHATKNKGSFIFEAGADKCLEFRDAKTLPSGLNLLGKVGIDLRFCWHGCRISGDGHGGWGKGWVGCQPPLWLTPQRCACLWRCSHKHLPSVVPQTGPTDMRRCLQLSCVLNVATKIQQR